jgi:hypothetical protein
MKWSDISVTIGKIAPVLGGALLGPAGVTVGTMLSGYLNVENTPDAIQQAMLEPGKAAEIVKFELEHKAELAQIALEHARLEIGDIQHARTQHKESIMPAVICLLLTFMVAAGAWMLFTQPIPEDNKEYAYIMFGALVAKWGDSIAYWVGTTRSSQNKDKIGRASCRERVLLLV